MKTKARRGSWMVTVPLAAAAVIYVTLVFLPGRRAIGEARDQIQQKQAYIAQSASLPMALNTAQRQLQKTRAYTAAWKEHAPTAGELSALYGKVHALAKAAGATTTRFDPEPVIPLDTISKIPLTVGCTGTFDQVCEFLRSLETLPMTVWVDAIKIEKLTGSEGFVVCELSLVVFADNPEISDYANRSE